MNKVFVITGGTSGIGKDISKRFAEEGNTVFIIARDFEKIKEFADIPNIIFIKCDLLEDKNIKEAFKEIEKQTSKIDVLINNAAYDHMSSIINYDYEEFSKIINTNLLGKMFCIKYATKLLKKSAYPVVINIASRLATRPMYDSSAYCCAAAGIVMLTKCAALELEKDNIRVNCISPSLTLTPLALKSYTSEEIDATKEKSTRKRLCSIDDIYNAIKFLTSSESDFINGENINVNGGILLK